MQSSPRRACWHPSTLRGTRHLQGEAAFVSATSTECARERRTAVSVILGVARLEAALDRLGLGREAVGERAAVDEVRIAVLVSEDRTLGRGVRGEDRGSAAGDLSADGAAADRDQVSAQLSRMSRRELTAQTQCRRPG